MSVKFEIKVKFKRVQWDKYTVTDLQSGEVHTVETSREARELQYRIEDYYRALCRAAMARESYQEK